jgi:diaminopimelate decarboxylase
MSAIDPRLLPTSALVSDRGLCVGGVALLDLAEQHGTPLFVYDVAHLRSRCRELAKAFGAEHVSYASKAFTCTAMVSLIASEGLGIDVASAGELAVALAGGVDASRVVVHGNNKSDVELATAMDVGVRAIVVDSHDELDRIERLYAAGHRCPDVLVRLTPGVSAGATQAIRTAEEDSKFGFSIRSGAAAEAVTRARQSTAMRWRGVHAHLGSQIFDVSALRRGASVVARFALAHGAEELSLGGGVGVAYTDDMPEGPSVEAWAGELRSAASDAGWHGPVDVEPGRLVAAQAAVTLYTVGTIKELPGAARTYAAVDGGFADNLRPALYGAAYEVFLPRAPTAPRNRRVRVVGKHCESGDVLVPDAAVPADLQVGDVLAIPVTGAYGYAMASAYNLLGRPAVVFVEDGSAREVLRRETAEDWLNVDALVSAAVG